MADNCSDNAAVRNCTLEDIDAACLDFQRYELVTVIRDQKIANYSRDSLGYTIQDHPYSWFNCTLSQSQEHLSPGAVSYIFVKIL